jgi:hypothetical protein
MSQEPTTERALVQAAVTDRGNRALLREKLRPHVASATEMLRKARGISPDQQEILTDIGMQSFEKAFNIYLKNLHHLRDEEGHFYAYYLWWARQAVVEHLESSRS